MENTYWSGNGKYQAAYDELVEKMPAMGKCDTVAGEMIRAASRLGYDFYNNGMGNNTSGALNYLREQSAIDDDVYDTIYKYTRGRIYEGRYTGDFLQVAIESMVDQTVGMIVNNPVLMTIENKEDMFDYQEEEQSFCEQCGEEMEGWSPICSDCEYWMEEEEEYV